jgi:hypothetical protein
MADPSRILVRLNVVEAKLSNCNSKCYDGLHDQYPDSGQLQDKHDKLEFSVRDLRQQVVAKHTSLKNDFKWLVERCNANDDLVLEVYEDKEHAQLKQDAEAQVATATSFDQLELMRDELTAPNLVTLCGLTSKSDLNGALGRILGPEVEGRLPIGLVEADSSHQKTIKVRPTNLIHPAICPACYHICSDSIGCFACSHALIPFGQSELTEQALIQKKAIKLTRKQRKKLRDASQGADASPINNLDGVRVGEMPSTRAASACSDFECSAGYSVSHFDGNVLPAQPFPQFSSVLFDGSCSLIPMSTSVCDVCASPSCVCPRTHNHTTPCYDPAFASDDEEKLSGGDGLDTIG